MTKVSGKKSLLKKPHTNSSILFEGGGRFRRLRTTQSLRDLLKETRLNRHDLIQPFFVQEGRSKKNAVLSMPGIDRFSVDLLLKSVAALQKSGGKAGLLFGIPNKKDLQGTQAFAQEGIVQKAVRAIKKEFPEFFIITDICLCGYLSHGHCGIIVDHDVDNDSTLKVLEKIALSHAAAGANMLAPSDMMDLRVGRIRRALDSGGFKNVPILSYAVKYASAFYGPFREAVDSAPQFGDRRTYQMDYANQREALKEAKQDVAEGADIVMVKPALAYLDVISLLRHKLNVPIAAFSVSGEYAMIKAAAQKGWINEKEIVMESLTAIKRAGADLIVSYHTQDALTWI